MMVRLVALCLVFLGFPSMTVAEEFMITTTSEIVRETPEKDLFNVLTVEAFRRLGHEAVVSWNPPKRAIFEANLGRINATGPRVRGIEGAYPNLVMVPEPLYRVALTGFSKDRDAVFDGWESLAGKRVAYVNGWILPERKIPKDAHVEGFAEQHLVLRVSGGRPGYVGVLNRVSGALLAKKMGIQVHPSPAPLQEIQLFLYVHKRHQGLVDDLARAVKRMAEDGTTKRLIDRYLAYHFDENDPIEVMSRSLFPH